MNLDRSVPPHPHDHLPAAPATLQVSSTDFVDGQPLPRSAGLRSGNTSPQLAWSGAPEGTASFMVLRGERRARGPAPFPPPDRGGGGAHRGRPL